MSGAPEVPDDFDSKEEVNQHIEQLENYVEYLEEQIAESETEKLDLKQELAELKEQASNPGSGSFASLIDPLQGMQERLKEFEEGNVDELGDGPSEEAKEEFFEAAGWHPDDN
ncbi:hypothetical protein [Haloferax sp. Q22]|uniref:hypothetical protein n=1 Tax=Haloferax sp. (strain Q22) TaxID=1526048 RepID=UPI000AB6906C|nr:hypothetical protein [Haloferax sp. Q22]